MRMRVGKTFLVIWVWVRIAAGLACFVLMNLFVAAAALCCVAVFAFAPRARARAISAAVRAGMRAVFFGVVPMLGGYDLFVDAENADFGKTSIYVCNHISLFDPLLLFSVIPNLGVVIKRRYASILAIWLLVRVFDFASLDEAGGADAIRRLVAEVKNALQKGRNMLIFPEGTRGRAGEMGAFKKSAFKIARELGVPIAPVAIYSPRPFLGKGEFVVKEKTYYKIKFLKPMQPEDYRSSAAFCDAASAAILAEIRQMRDRGQERAQKYF